MKMLLTKRFTFEMAHALPDYKGKCSNIHGHSYHLEVTVEGEPMNAPGSSEDGMVIDFGRIKDVVNETIISVFDHALVLPRNDKHTANFEPYLAKLILVDFQPTTENLLIYFSKLLQPKFQGIAKIHSLRLSETETSTAELIL